MIRIGFYALAIGAVFALVSIPLGGYDILPDFLGYCLIAFGSTQVRHLDGRFKLAAAIAAPLIPLSLSQYFEPDPSRALGWIGPMRAIVTVALFALLWQLATGVKAAAGRTLQADLAARAEITRWVLLYLMAAYLATLVVSNFAAGLVRACTAIDFLLFLAMAAVVFHLLRKAGDILGEPPSDTLTVPVARPAAP